MSGESDIQGVAVAPQPAARNWRVQIQQFWQYAIRFVPPKLRWLIVAIAVLGLGVYFYSSWTTSAKLKVVGRHGFRSATVYVSIDGNAAWSNQVSGATKRRLGVLPKFEGSFSKTLGLGAGNHIVQVRLVSPADHFDQTQECAVSLIGGQEATLAVSGGKSGISLAFQGGPPNPLPPSADFSYVAYVRSILLTVGGSAMSAAIGFIVQDFLKSKKTGAPVPDQPQQS